MRVEREGVCLHITLHRPGRHNAVDAALREHLVEALLVACADPSIERVVVDGAGPSFCSGGDLAEFGTLPDPATAHLVRLTRSPARLLAELAPRLEVRLHGACVGAGIEMAAFARRVVARPDTLISLPEIGLGLIPGAGGTVSLPRRIGRHRTAGSPSPAPRSTPPPPSAGASSTSSSHDGRGRRGRLGGQRRNVPHRASRWPPTGRPGGLRGPAQGHRRRTRPQFGRAGRRLDLDVLALLGERAALTGLGRGGDVSCGRRRRASRTADGWLAVNLPRPDDLDLVPAWPRRGGTA